MSMKRICTFCLLALMAFSMTACKFNYMSPEEVEAYLDGIVNEIGDSQITENGNLIGNRTLDADAYTGEYSSECKACTGRDVVFGGGSIKERKLKVSGRIMTDSGEALIRIRQNDDVVFLNCDEDGYFESTLHLSGGGNYIMAVYEDFTGEITMNCEYADSESDN